MCPIDMRRIGREKVGSVGPRLGPGHTPWCRTATNIKTFLKLAFAVILVLSENLII